MQDVRLISEITQYQANLADANDWMTASESSLQSLLDSLQRSQVTAEQMATGTIQPLEYQTTASEVQGIIEQIVTLANTRINGSYIFGGTRTSLPPVVNNIEATGYGPGSATSADTTLISGLYHLQLSRDDAGESSTFSMTSANTLGQGLGTPLDFNSWTVSQSAQDSPDQGEISYSAAGVASLNDAVSNRVGETLSWTGDSEAGQQTYTTEGIITVVGPGGISIDGTVYNVSDASDLVQDINANAGGDYFAWLEGSQTVKVISRNTGASPFSISGASGGVSGDVITTMRELAEDINLGRQAKGVVNLTGVPLGSDTITLGGNHWTWDQITAGQTLSTVDEYADALASFISEQTDEYSATASSSGGRATVQVSARVAGAAGNVLLTESGANTVASGSLYGGFDPTELNPLSSGVQVEHIATLVSDHGEGHAVVAREGYFVTSGTYHLQLTRDTVGLDATVDSISGDLGASLGYDFTSYATIAYADANTAQVLSSTQGLAASNSEISTEVGETLTFEGGSAAGTQTYRTEGVVQVTATGPGATLDVGGVSYDASSAEALVEDINQAATGEYFAWLEQGTTTVHIVSTGGSGSPFAVDNPAGGAAVNFVNSTGSYTAATLDGVIADLNSGVTASGNFHLSGAPDAGGTVSVGDQTWTWAEIFGGAANVPATAEEAASGLAGWINQHSSDVEASVTSSGGGATVQISARSVGSYGNGISLSSTGSNISDTGALFGGLDGTDSEAKGRLYGSGEADLRYSTVIQATVTEVDGDAATLHLSWYGDYGELHENEILIKASGEENGVEVPGMGGLKIYKDADTFTEGAVFSISVGHNQGNDEEVAVNFSADSHMAHNWTIDDILGGHKNSSLLGQTALAKSGNTSGGVVNFAGSYTGEADRELNIDVIDAGNVPADAVTLRVSWVDEEGLFHEEDITLSGLGQENSVTLPDSDGIEIYLTKGASDVDYASFTAGDGFYKKIEKDPVSVLDSMVDWEYQLLYGSQVEAQHTSQQMLESLDVNVTKLLDQIAEIGSRQNRVEVRSTILEDKEVFATNELGELQEVDLTEAFLDLQALQVSFSASLKVMATMSEMSLVNIMD